MKKINIIKKNQEFTRIFQTIKAQQSANFLFYLEWTKEENYAFGIAVSQKNASAVKRNFIKRRIRSIIDQYQFKKGFNCIILCRKNIEEKPYEELRKEMEKFFQKNKLLEVGEI